MVARGSHGGIIHTLMILNAILPNHLETGPHQSKPITTGLGGSVDDLQLACSYRNHFAGKPSLWRAARLWDFTGQREHSGHGLLRLLFRDDFLAANQGSWAEWTASQQRTTDHFYSFQIVPKQRLRGGSDPDSRQAGGLNGSLAFAHGAETNINQHTRIIKNPQSNPSCKMMGLAEEFFMKPHLFFVDSWLLR